MSHESLAISQRLETGFICRFLVTKRKTRRNRVSEFTNPLGGEREEVKELGIQTQEIGFLPKRRAVTKYLGEKTGFLITRLSRIKVVAHPY